MDKTNSQKGKEKEVSNSAFHNHAFCDFLGHTFSFSFFHQANNLKQSYVQAHIDVLIKSDISP